MTRDFATTRSAARSHQLAPLQRPTTEVPTNSNLPAFFGWYSPPHPCRSAYAAGLRLGARTKLSTLHTWFGTAGRLFHRVQTKPVSLGVDHEGNEAVLADGKLFLMYASSRFRDAAFLDRAILATEIDQGAVAARGNALHLDQRTAGARSVHLHRKRPHLDSWAVQLFQLAVERGFVEFLRAIEVLHVDLEPDNRVVLHRGSPLLATALSGLWCASPAASGRLPRRTRCLSHPPPRPPRRSSPSFQGGRECG